MRCLQPMRRGVNQALRRQSRLRNYDDVASMRCGGEEQCRIAADHLEQLRDSECRRHLIEQPSSLGCGGVLLLDKLLAIQLLPLTDS